MRFLPLCGLSFESFRKVVQLVEFSIQIESLVLRVVMHHHLSDALQLLHGWVPELVQVRREAPTGILLRLLLDLTLVAHYQ